jgi:hypothetical protein
VNVFSQPVYAQSACLVGDIAKQIVSKAGIPTSTAAALLKAITPEFTADASIDQVTQLSSVFQNKNAGELNEQDANYSKAIDFVKTKMPSTVDNQTCVENMEKVRANIKKELSQREREHVPPTMSPNQFTALKQKQK